MKIIFLDIDGVLNCRSSKSRCGGYIGIDNDKLLFLKQIVDATKAEIVLVSTWKYGWYKRKEDKCKQDALANYMDRKFKAWLLEISDKTRDKLDGVYFSRGEGIAEYLNAADAESYVILDDCQFDYDGFGLTDNYIKTDNEVGLTADNVRAAIDVLGADK